MGTLFEKIEVTKTHWKYFSNALNFSKNKNWYCYFEENDQIRL